VPLGLNPGDQYRLAFVTSTTRDATSSNINDYNAFVTAAANAVPELSALNTTWTAIVSTDTVDARDNTNTNPNNAVGVPVYLLNDTIIAGDNAKVWDGYVPRSFNIDEHGNQSSVVLIWTGTGWDGFASANYALGSASGQALIGTTRTPDWQEFGRWIDDRNQGPSLLTASRPFYAISGTLTYIPEPGTAVLLAFGLAGLATAGRRRSLH